MYILRPHAAGILYAPPPLIHPPPLGGSFQGWGGGGVYKIWPKIDPTLEFSPMECWCDVVELASLYSGEVEV